MGKGFTEKEKEYLKEIGNKLKFYRNKKNLTQKEVAAKIGIKAQDIGRYENGKQDIKLIALKKFCTCYGINVSTLLYGIEKPQNTNFDAKIIELKDEVKNFNNKVISIANSLQSLK